MFFEIQNHQNDYLKTCRYIEIIKVLFDSGKVEKSRSNKYYIYHKHIEEMKIRINFYDILHRFVLLAIHELIHMLMITMQGDICKVFIFPHFSLTCICTLCVYVKHK